MSAQSLRGNVRASSVRQLEVDWYAQLAQRLAQLRRESEAARLARRNGDDQPYLATFGLHTVEELRMPAQHAADDDRQCSVERGRSDGVRVPRYERCLGRPEQQRGEIERRQPVAVDVDRRHRSTPRFARLAGAERMLGLELQLLRDRCGIDRGMTDTQRQLKRIRRLRGAAGFHRRASWGILEGAVIRALDRGDRKCGPVTTLSKAAKALSTTPSK